MSEFSVVTSMVEGMSARLGVISSDVDELHGQMGAHGSAAAQTPLDGALSGLMGNWAAVLPHFGFAGDRLQGAMRGAAGAYQAADADVGNAANASDGR